MHSNLHARHRQYLTRGEDARQLARVEYGHGEGCPLGVLGVEEVGMPVLHLVTKVICRSQEVLRCDAGCCLQNTPGRVNVQYTMMAVMAAQ